MFPNWPSLPFASPSPPPTPPSAFVLYLQRPPPSPLPFTLCLLTALPPPSPSPFTLCLLTAILEEFSEGCSLGGNLLGRKRPRGDISRHVEWIHAQSVCCCLLDRVADATALYPCRLKSQSYEQDDQYALVVDGATLIHVFKGFTGR